jgi:hypothetical protein
MTHITARQKLLNLRNKLEFARQWSAGDRRPMPIDVAGVGDGITELPKRARRWKRLMQLRNFLRIYAPALDPTRFPKNDLSHNCHNFHCNRNRSERVYMVTIFVEKQKEAVTS